MKKIEKLTQKQEEYLIEFRQKYLDIALSPDRINRDRLTAALARVYETVDKKPPKLLVAKSPTHANFLLENLQKGTVLSETSFGKPKGKNNEYMWGKQDLFWIAHYIFCEEIGVKYTDKQSEKLKTIHGMSIEGMWWWPYENYCVVSENPMKIKWDDQKLLHSDNSLAVEFEDGTGIACWHGVTVPTEWILKKDFLTSQMVLTLANAELRRCACEILGWIKVLEDATLNPKIIDVDDPLIGTLIQVDLPGAPQQWFLKYQCGTGRWFAEAVNDKRFDTAVKANAGKRGWRPEFQTPPENFIPFIRT